MRVAAHCLTRAFGSFTQATGSLKTSYGQPQVEVMHLGRELEVTNQGLSRSLEENARIRAYLSRILEGLPLGVLVFDEEGAMRVANPEACRLLGIESDGSAVGSPELARRGWSLLQAIASESGTAQRQWQRDENGTPQHLGVTRALLPRGDWGGLCGRRPT